MLPRTEDKNSGTRRRRILMLTHRVPCPPDRGDRIRGYYLLRQLSKSFDVDLACTSSTPVAPEHRATFRESARRLLITPICTRGSVLTGSAALVRGHAITPSWHYRSALARTIRQWHRHEPYDAVLTISTGMARYARCLASPAGAAQRSHRPRLVLDLVDVDSLKWRRYAQRSAAPMRWVYGLEARRLRRVEADQAWDAVTVISDAEAADYRLHVGNAPRLEVVGNGVDLDTFAALPDPRTSTLVFTGVLNYRPNVEGICWFVAHVMPLLRRLPQVDVRLMIVGRDPCAAVRDLDAEPAVEVVGPVADVRNALRESSIAIAPLQIARGVQNKVLEAMASARAVVASPAAAQGIDAVPGRHLLVADLPHEWAGHIERLLRDAHQRRVLGLSARQLVEDQYTWTQRSRPMVDLLHNLIDESRRAPSASARREAA